MLVSAADLNFLCHFNWVLGNVIWGFVDFFFYHILSAVQYNLLFTLVAMVGENNDQGTNYTSLG